MIGNPMRLTLATLFFATMAVLLARCGPSAAPTGKTELVYWRSLTGAAGDAQDRLVEGFNELEDRIHVTSEFQGSLSELATKLVTAATAGQGPDIAQVGTFEIRSFAREGLLVDLTPFMAGSDGIDTADWPGTIAQAGLVDGRVYWLPFNVAVPVLYYNADALERTGIARMPDTWDGFFDLARRLTERDASGRVTRAGLALWDITWPYLAMIWSEGGELTNRDYSNVTLNDPVVIAVLTRLQALVKEGSAIMPNPAAGGHRAAFMSGQAAMILDSPAPFDEIMRNAVGFKPAVASYPAGKAGRVYPPGGAGIAMLARTPKDRRAAAWTFMKYLLSPSSLAYYAEKSGYLAFTGQSQALAAELLAQPERATMHKALEFVRGDFSVTMSPAVRTAFDDAFKKIVVDLADVKTTLDEADLRAERELEEEQ